MAHAISTRTASSSFAGTLCPQPYASSHPLNRRKALLGIGGMFTSALLVSDSSAVAATTTEATTPFQDAKRIVYGPTSEGRIRPCPTNVNPNCVSTGSTNQSYSPAWRATQRTAEEAAAALETTVLYLYKDVQLEKQAQLESGQFLAFSVPGLYGRDVFEFIIRPEGVTDRNWEGDQEGPLVTYRSIAGGVKYIWPIQQPLTDFGAQSKRVEEIRKAVGWKLIGCELIECYEFGPEPFF